MKLGVRPGKYLYIIFSTKNALFVTLFHLFINEEILRE